MQPPREEEYLGEISLGLHTIESFDSEPPKPYEAKVQDFQEMTFDRLDVEHTSDTPAPLPIAEVPAPPPAAVSAPPEPATSDVVERPHPAAYRWAELPKTPLPPAESAGPPKQEQNRSAFQTWLSRLKGGRS